jgi:hypothetical protein
MAKQTRSIQKKTLNAPEEIRTFDKGKVELATVGTVTFGRASFEPGWKWSESVKPIVKTDYCEAPHVQYHVSGRLKIRMADGSEEEFGPGDVGTTPPGHDAWVVGDEPVVVIDISGMREYVKPAAKRGARNSRNEKQTKRNAETSEKQMRGQCVFQSQMIGADASYSSISNEFRAQSPARVLVIY